MMNKIIRISAIVVATALFSGQSYSVDDLTAAFGSDVLVIEASEHACYRFDVFLALTGQQQARGLMHVRQLPEFHGMLFVYRPPRVISMWMKNTYIPLDMVFFRADGSISSIETNTQPLSERSIHATEPLSYVLELNGGVTERLGIDGDSVIHLPTDREQ